MKQLQLFVLMVLGSGVPPLAGQQPATLPPPAKPAADQDIRIFAGQLAVHLSKEGHVVAVSAGQPPLVRALQADTRLAGCGPIGPVTVEKQAGDRVCFVRKLAHAASGGQCTLRESFLVSNDSIRWEVEINGHGNAWSTPVETRLAWPNKSIPAKFWLAQSGDREPDPPMHFLTDKLGDRKLLWSDPLEPSPFRNLELPYGGGAGTPGFCLPLVTVIEERSNLGWSLALSPHDVPSTMTFRADSEASMCFTRENLRISQDKPLRLAMDLVAHEGDWRPAADWMVKHYPEFFESPNPDSARIAGCGAFCSSYAGDLDSAKLKAMACRLNWGFGFTFPYVGMYLPYVKEGDEWTSFEGRKVSTRLLDDLAKKWQAAGIHTLAEFVTTEWGYKTLDGQRIPSADVTAEKVNAASFYDGDLWKDATRFLLEKLPGATLFGSDNKPVYSVLDLPTSNVVIDPGEPILAEFLTDQARRFIREVPHCDGICIDRMDWLEKFNPRRDDGVTWIDGKPARSLRVSWLRIMDRLGPLLHDAGKTLFVNPHIKRLDLMRHVDGMFDEYGYLPPNNNMTAFLGLRKPVTAWTPSADYFRQDPDAFFQRYLYLGIFPMAPFPENATPVAWLHAIQPGEQAEKPYLDYGLLLDQIRGKKWVLEPNVVRVKDAQAKANLFEVPGAHVIPVVFGGSRPQVTVALRKFPGLPAAPHCEAFHPGSTIPVTVKTTATAAGLELEVPLVRGCAMVRVSAPR